MSCNFALLAKLHDLYLYKTDNFFHINHYLKSVSKVALSHRFYCRATMGFSFIGVLFSIPATYVSTEGNLKGSVFNSQEFVYLEH